MSHSSSCPLHHAQIMAALTAEKCCREEVARFQNTELCRLTEQVIFTDPYYAAPVNRHTSPQLDAVAASFRTDVAAKVAAARLKARCLCWLAMSVATGPGHVWSLQQAIRQLNICLSNKSEEYLEVLRSLQQCLLITGGVHGPPELDVHP